MREKSKIAITSATLAAAVGMAFLGGAAPLDPQTFHLMQIEEVIAGVEGDTNAQVIQLRMRAFGQNLMSQAKLMAYDATGANPVVLIDFGTNVANGLSGDRVLVRSAGFDPTWTTPTMVSDFTMTNPIPASYLAAGRLTFENNAGTQVLWSLAWGGAAYTGPNTGTLDNDIDGNFSPPWPDPLPTAGLACLMFDGAASDKSTNNAADYILSDPAVFGNNARNSFTLIGPPDDCIADFNGDGTVNTVDVLSYLNKWAAKDASADINGDGTVNTLDFILFLNLWNEGC